MAELPDSLTRIPFFDSTEDLPSRQPFFDSLDDMPTRQPFFDSLSDYEGDAEDPRLAENKAAQKKIMDWLSTFHGAEPTSTGSLRRQVEKGDISGADYFAMTGRVYGGDTVQRDARGNITGYGGSGGSGLDALDTFQYRQANQMEGDGYDPFAGALSHGPLPGSVAATVDAPSEGMAMAADVLTTDTRLRAPTTQSIQGTPTSFVTPSPGSTTRVREQKAANEALRANYRAAGLPDPTIGATNVNGITVAGNVGAHAYPRMPNSIWS